MGGATVGSYCGSTCEWDRDESGGGVTPPPTNFVMEQVQLKQRWGSRWPVAVVIGLSGRAQRGWRWEFRVLALGAGNEFAGGRERKYSTFNMTNPADGLVTWHRSNSIRLVFDVAGSIICIMAKRSLVLIFRWNDPGVGYSGGLRSEYWVRLTRWLWFGLCPPGPSYNTY